MDSPRKFSRKVFTLSPLVVLALAALLNGTSSLAKDSETAPIAGQSQPPPSSQAVGDSSMSAGTAASTTTPKERVAPAPSETTKGPSQTTTSTPSHDEPATMPAPEWEIKPATASESPATQGSSPSEPKSAVAGADAKPIEHAKAASTKPVMPAKPVEKGPPPGFDAAVKLYSTRKFALAAKEFEKFIKQGYGDVQVHAYLAYCLYNERMYSKALKEFDWVTKNATHSITLQRSAESSAHTIRCYMSGVCPGNCLKANDPRWHHMRVAGHPDTDVWITFSAPGGSHSWSQNHIGEVIEYVNGSPENKGACPICGGSGRVPVLKDGMPLPQ